MAEFFIMCGPGIITDILQVTVTQTITFISINVIAVINVNILVFLTY